MSKRSAIVVGATGLVGSSLVKQLCEQENYVSVLTIGRNSLDYEHKKLVQRIRSLDEISEGDLDFAHDVFCCLGTTIKTAGSRAQFEKVDFEYPMQVASLAKNRGVDHFIVISAMGASQNSKAYYSRVKGNLEAELGKLDFPRLSIVRPSLLVGNRKEFRFGERAGAAVLNLVNPLLIAGLKKYRSIEASQVAVAMIGIALSTDTTPVRIYESNELAEMQLPKMGQNEGSLDREATFNWNKLKEGDQTVIDQDVVFDRTKIKTVDNDLPK